MKCVAAALILAMPLAACSPATPAANTEAAEPATPVTPPAPPNKDIFSGAFANSKVEGTRAAVAGTPEGLSFTAEGDDPNILITPATAIDSKAVTKVVITFKKIDVKDGEYALFYRTADRDFDPVHFSYASSWEDVSPTDVRLTFDFTAAASTWGAAPVTQLRFDPVPGATGVILLTSVEASR